MSTTKTLQVHYGFILESCEMRISRMAYFAMLRSGSIIKRCFPLSPPSWHRLVSAKRSVISTRLNAFVFTFFAVPKKHVSFLYLKNCIVLLQHIQVIFLILAAILHLANIVFMPIEETDGVSVADEYPLHAVAKLLGIDDEVELTEALISNVSTIKGKFLILNSRHFCCRKYVDIENVYNRENDWLKYKNIHYISNLETRSP